MPPLELGARGLLGSLLEVACLRNIRPDPTIRSSHAGHLRQEERLPRDAKLRLAEDDARRLLLVRAIEADDSSAALLTREDREHVTRAALAQVGPTEGRRQSEGAAFLAQRSRFALDRLAARYPAIGQAERGARWPGWINWALPLAALLLGWMSNEVFDGRRLNVISFPLFGMLAWNLAVYALLIIAPLRRTAGHGGPNAQGPITRVLARAAHPLRRLPSAQPTLTRSIGRFAGDWLHYASGLNSARANRAMHLAAAALATGVVVGMYASGWDVEYRAGWESTWIRDAGTLHALLATVLGPASALTGIALPTTAELPALDWGAGRSGVNAAPWIHLYAATALLFIIGPRLLLAGVFAVKAAARRRRMPVPGSEDFYVRTLLRSAQGTAASVRVVPYSFSLPDETQKRLRRLLADVLGEQTHVATEPSIAYGGEDDWLGGADVEARDDDYVIVLFNLSATPEAENHGALVVGIGQRLAKADRDVVLAVVLDEAAMRRHLGNQPDVEARLETRRQAWRTMFQAQGIEPLAVDLGSGDHGELARALEAGLTRSTKERAA